MQQVFDGYSVGLIEANHLFEQDVPFGDIGLVVFGLDGLPFQNLQQNNWEFGVYYVVLVGLVAAVQHPDHALYYGLYNIYDAYCYFQVLGYGMGTDDWSRFIMM